MKKTEAGTNEISALKDFLKISAEGRTEQSPFTAERGFLFVCLFRRNSYYFLLFILSLIYV